MCEHLALVRSIARRFGREADQRDDLVQEGVVGLLKAIRRFDPGATSRSPPTRSWP